MKRPRRHILFPARRPAPRSPRGGGGFTLLESICSIVIIGIIGLTASALIARASRTTTAAVNSAQQHSELATAMERIDRTLRQIGKKAGATAPNITDLTATSITFDTLSTISLSGGNLRINDAGAGDVTLIGGVTSFTITAYDESNAQLAASLSGAGCDTIRRLSVSITVSRVGISDTLRTRVFLRCTMSGNANG